MFPLDARAAFAFVDRSKTTLATFDSIAVSVEVKATATVVVNGQFIAVHPGQSSLAGGKAAPGELRVRRIDSIRRVGRDNDGGRAAQ